MRIGIDLRQLQNKKLTGVGEYAYQIIKALRRQDVCLAGYANTRGNLPDSLDTELDVVYESRSNRWQNFLFDAGLGETLPKKFAKVGKPINALWLPYPNFVKFDESVPAVLTVHDLSFFHYPELFPWRGRLWYFPAMMRLLKNLPSNVKVVAVSQHTASDLTEQFPALNNHISVITPGVTEEYFSQPTAEEITEVRKRYSLPEKYILSLGTLEPRKNYGLLIRAYEELIKRQPDYSYDLVIAGDWGWNNKEFKNIYARLRSRERIHLVGYVRAHDKLTLYAQAFLFLYPSLFEGFGMPPLEAMAAGVPVLTSHTSSLPEVVAEAGILLDPYRIDPWVAAVEWLSSDAKAWQKFSLAGKIRAKKFTWTRAAASYSELFLQLCE